MSSTQKSPVARLLADLIAIPSVNPAFLPAGDSRTGEARVAAHLAQLAVESGLKVERQPVVEGRDNLLVRLPPSGPIRRRILLAPHLDTVGEPGLTPQLQPRFIAGKIHGRGACDTKGCVATMFQALLDVAQRGPRPHETELLFVGLIDEENFQLGSRHYATLVHQGKQRASLGADLAIVGEPTELEVVTAHKGDVWLQLRTRGVAAHGATPHLGTNAVAEMARAVLALTGDYPAELKKRPAHPLLGRPTINVGAIRGGTQPNIVPDRCELLIDRRFLPGETPGGVRQEIAACLRRARVKAEFVELRNETSPALETDPNQPLVRQLLAVAGRKRTHGVHYFCDAAVLSAAGIPAVVFGPGNIAQAHTTDEWIVVAQLDRATAILADFMRQQP